MGRGLSRAWSRGSIFVDVVVTLLIAATALVITLGGIALTARTSRVAAARARQLIEARNEDARNRGHTFARELADE